MPKITLLTTTPHRGRHVSRSGTSQDAGSSVDDAPGRSHRRDRKKQQERQKILVKVSARLRVCEGVDTSLTAEEESLAFATVYSEEQNRFVQLIPVGLAAVSLLLLYASFVFPSGTARDVGQVVLFAMTLFVVVAVPTIVMPSLIHLGATGTAARVVVERRAGQQSRR